MNCAKNRVQNRANCAKGKTIMNLQQKIEMLKDSKILSSEPIFDSINPKKISGIYLKVALINGKQATIEILGCDNYTEKCKANNFDVII